MKNKTVKSLSILLSVCMLGTSSAGAAEFSSGPAAVEEIPAQTESPDADTQSAEIQSVQGDSIDLAGNLTDQNSTEKSE